MTYQLSLLDTSPIPDGASAAEALECTIALAQRADVLGYRRFWVAEHHGSTALASSAPEILVAHILAKTSRIRVGSGGVMLQHYSPYKVAESFKVLAALAPGRVDLGVGKAPGGFPITTRALQRLHDPLRKHDFADQLADLDGFLSGALPAHHALSGAVATPIPPQSPDRILLGSNAGSAELAASHGWGFCYAGHFNSDPDNLARSIAAYQGAGERPAMLALYAFVAGTQEKAERLVGDLRIIRLHLATGQTVNLDSFGDAVEFARQAGVDDYETEEIEPHVIAGTAHQVHARLAELSRRYGIQEFVIDTPVAGFSHRLESIELLAHGNDAFGL